MSATYENKQKKKMALEQAVRDYLKAAELDGDLFDETVDAIIDIVYDGSDKAIKLNETY